MYGAAPPRTAALLRNVTNHVPRLGLKPGFRQPSGLCIQRVGQREIFEKNL